MTVSQPIACHLDANAAGAQWAEWHALLSGMAAPERPTPTELRVHLGDGRLEDVVDLARREKACCPFFDFTLQIDADDIVLSISVPAEATGLLDDLARAAT